MVGAQTNFSLLPFYTQDILQSEIKIKQKRQDFKNVCNMKMRENLYNEDDPDLITKKFWSHIKSNSKSCRLPETQVNNYIFQVNNYIFIFGILHFNQNI